ncbi:uncharacterized protein LOC142572053 isoform X3 [Dermacentor variabilis]
MLLVGRLCACLVLLHRLHALPVQNATPSLLRFHGDERGGHYEVVLDEPLRGMNAFRVDDDLKGSKMAAGEEDDHMGQNYYNRILRKKAAVTRGPRPQVRPERHETCDDDRDCRRSPSQICIKHARELHGRCQCPFYRPVEATFNGVVRCVTAKDLFDECRSNEECAATNPYLECVNRLCSCPPPHVLKDHAECIGSASVQEWISWLVPVAVVALAGVGMAAWLISKRKESSSGSGNSDDNDAEGAPAAEPGASSCRQQPPVQHQQSTQHAPESRYRGYSGEGGGAVPRGYPHSDVLSRLNVPPMKDWVRVPKGLRGNAQGSLDGAGGGGAADHNRVMWAQQAFTSLASPIYQNKLVRRLMAGKGASSSYPDSSSVAEPMPPRSAMASPAPPSALSARYGSEVPPLPTSLQESLRSDERSGHGEVVLDEPGRGMKAFRVEDDLEGSKMAAGEEDGSMGRNYNRILRKKAAVTRGPRPQVRPERHETCDDDRDCRRSPSQICIKHARELHGRCQCPFYRPVEATFNGVVRCVTAKDLFDECRSNEECAATNPYLECVNRLCSCPPPHVLKDHAECIGGASVQDWISWLVLVAVLAVTGVGMAAWLISKRNKKSSSDSGNSDDNDAEGAPAAEPAASSCRQQPPVQHQQSTHQAPESRYRGYSGEDGGAVHKGYQHSDVLSRLNVPPMKDWVRVPKGFRRNAQCTLDDAGGGGAADQNRVMWAQQAFTSLASPIYQNKLVRRLMAGKGASSSYPDSSSVAEPMPPRSAMASPAPPSALSARYGSEVPPLHTSLQESLRRIAAASGRSSQRLQPHQRRATLTTCSDEASSFRSFPVSGARSGKSQRYAAAAADDDDDDEETRAPPSRLRSRSSSRYSAAAREPRSRSESSDALPTSPRKVFFANY